MSRLFAHVMCGVDFSDSSARAVAWAHFVASRLRQRLLIVSVVESLLAKAAPARFLDDARRDLERFVAPFVGGRTDPPVTLEVGVGKPAEVLLEKAGDEHAMIVVGTHGLGRAERLLFGSVTHRLMRAAKHSVLSVPHARTGEGEAVPEEAPGVERIVCGVDFSAASVAAARAAHALGLALSVPVELVHALEIVTIPTVWDMVLAPSAEEQIASALAQLEAVARDLGTPAPRSAARISRPEDVLAKDAAHGRSLIVLGLGDAGGHRPGTTAMRIVSRTKVPVLTVPLE
jgi:nucleotide-binding universal stress UspA family protein